MPTLNTKKNALFHPYSTEEVNRTLLRAQKLRQPFSYGGLQTALKEQMRPK